MNLSQAKTILQNLKTNKFIDIHTRLIVADFNTYNPNLNAHNGNYYDTFICNVVLLYFLFYIITVARVGFEFPVSGGVLPSYETKVWSFLRYDASSGTALFVLEIITVTFIVFFTMQEAYEVYSDGYLFFSQFVFSARVFIF